MADFRENVAIQLWRQGSFALLRCFICNLWIWESSKKWDFENLLKFKRLNLFVNNNEDLLRLGVPTDKHSHLSPTELPLRLILLHTTRSETWSSYYEYLIYVVGWYEVSGPGVEKLRKLGLLVAAAPFCSFLELIDYFAPVLTWVLLIHKLHPLIKLCSGE